MVVERALVQWRNIDTQALTFPELRRTLVRGNNRLCTVCIRGFQNVGLNESVNWNQYVNDLLFFIARLAGFSR